MKKNKSYLINNDKDIKQEIIDFLNEYNFNKKELKYIWDFVFYLYTGDYDILANQLKALLNDHSNNFIDSNYEVITENEYMNYGTEIDGSKYLKIRDDVELYDHSNKAVNDILDKYSSIIDEKSYYIKGNYLFFTIDDIRYWAMISHHSDEELYVNDIINELNIVGCNRVMYKYGCLD